MELRYVFGGDDYECGDDFYFNVGYSALKEAFKEIIAQKFGIAKDNIEAWKLILFIVDSLDIEDTLIEVYEEEVKEYFKDKAYENYEDEKLYKKDPLGYYGVSQKDFY